MTAEEHIRKLFEKEHPELQVKKVGKDCVLAINPETGQEDVFVYNGSSDPRWVDLSKETIIATFS